MTNEELITILAQAAHLIREEWPSNHPTSQPVLDGIEKAIKELAGRG